MTTDPATADAAGLPAAIDESDALWDEAEADDPTGPPEIADEVEDQGTADPTTPQDETWEESQASPPAPAADIWASAPPELRTQFEKLKADRKALEQKMRSDEGRVASYQRKYEEARAAALQPPAPVASAEDDDEMRAFAEEYPEVAAPILKIQKQLTGQIAQLTAAEDTRRTEKQTAEAAKMDALHPDWRTVAGTKQDVFRIWFEQQPEDVQDAARRNADNIVDATEAADVMGRFKQFLGRFEAASAPPGASPPLSPSDSRRQRQLRASQAPAPRSQVGVQPGIPPRGDTDAMWDAMERQDALKAQQRR